ncbi:MAG: hypothetical protein KJO07_23930 [Deltaproteobacteria bacterium]|nr:hypothetical protein [Deltaproteobacteria bacterium]
MLEGLGQAVGAAEALAEAGDYRAAGKAVEELSPSLPGANRPDLLARAAWVAAISALAGGRLDEFDSLKTIASEAAELVSADAKAELELLAHRIATMATMAQKRDNLDAAVMLALRDHALLLLRIDATGEGELWRVVDAERADWTHLFLAARERLGRPCRAEQYLRLAPTDDIGRVVLAVVLGLGRHADISPDQLAGLCFERPDTALVARKRIDDFVRDRRLTIEDDQVRLIMPTR